LEDEPIRSSEFLSQQLMAYIEDELDRPEEPSELGEEDYEKYRRIIRAAIFSLEGFAEPWAMQLVRLVEESRADFQWHADDFYTREVVANVQGMVNRFARLSPVLVGVVPSKNVGAYLREASRCFIYGFFQATIGLCRVALEAGLNKRLEPLSAAVADMNLYGKIERAAGDDMRLLSPATASLAHDVRRKANDVLHGEPVQQQNLAFDMLVQTRGILRELYEK